MTLDDNKPYIEGYNSDECEEEVDDEDSEDFDDTGDYMTDEQWEAAKAQGANPQGSKDEDEHDQYQDKEESEFEGFSDDNEA